MTFNERWVLNLPQPNMLDGCKAGYGYEVKMVDLCETLVVEALKIEEL
jgi:hypothetical protein